VVIGIFDLAPHFQKGDIAAEAAAAVILPP
jgi:hypothetical protein